MGQKQNIVILGGGFVGLVLARRLVKAGVVGKSCEVTIIDKNSAHVYTPWLYEVSSGYLSRDDGRRDLCKLYTSASVPYAGMPGYNHVRFRQEKVTGVDFQSKTVFLSDGLTVRYDSLVIAFGTEANYFGIPGLPENCAPLKTAADAIEVERRVRAIVAVANLTNRQHISVIGGGATGVEFTGELMMALHQLEKRGELMKDSVSVSLIDRKYPLGSFPEPLSRLATKRLEKLGAKVMSNLAVMSANAQTLTLKDESGNTILQPCDLAVWSGGVMPATIVKTLALPMDPKGRILVDPTFAVQGVKDVYAAGDCSALLNPRTNSFEPMSAQVSVNQGMWLAKNFIRQLRGESVQPFPFWQRWDSLITVGGKYGVGYVKGFIISGPFAFFARRIVDGRYFFWILPVRYAFIKWFKGVVIYNKND